LVCVSFNEFIDLVWWPITNLVNIDNMKMHANDIFCYPAWVDNSLYPFWSQGKISIVEFYSAIFWLVSNGHIYIQ